MATAVGSGALAAATNGQAETEASLIRQYVALMKTEGVTLAFTEDAIDALADAAAEPQWPLAPDLDDEIATGGTILEAAELVMRLGAASVEAAAVHGVLSGHAVERIRSSALRRLIVTDSIPLPESKRDPRIEVVSVAGLLSDAIGRIHRGESVAHLASRR